MGQTIMIMSKFHLVSQKHEKWICPRCEETLETGVPVAEATCNNRKSHSALSIQMHLMFSHWALDHGGREAKAYVKGATE